MTKLALEAQLGVEDRVMPPVAMAASASANPYTFQRRD